MKAIATLAGVFSILFPPACAWAEPEAVPLPLPPEVVEQLASEEFREREAAELELLAWARRKPAEGMDRLYELSRAHADPEVRTRCMNVLRDLVADEYLLEGGEGFIGITMMEENVMVPGDDNPRKGIRVTQVVPGTPSAKAGIVVGDLMVGMDDQVWRDVGTVFQFGDEVKRMKPGTRVVMKLLRNGQVEDVPLTLARRPPGLERSLLDLTPEELMKADRAAKERYFREWMDRRREAE